MTCPNCASELVTGEQFCATCGASVADPGAATVIVAAADPRDALLQQLRKELANDYEVERELGRGGMAIVYRAHEIELRRLVALKVLPPGLGPAELAERFRREARMAAALDHPNIIPIYRVGQAAGTHYFAMKFVEGRAVDAIVEQQGALPIPVVMQILLATARALAFAHERHTVHRDIKGANILVDRDGRVLVSDFGIARAAEEKTLTASGVVIGTPHFMSPEQCAGKKAGPQSDQYAMGVLAFQMLTGQVPFDADSVITIIQHHYFTPVPDVLSVRDDVPTGLLAVVYKALAKAPGQRYETTREMVRALETVPFSAQDKAQSEELLRELAKGAPIPKVRTGTLPPLEDVRRSGAAALAAEATTLTSERPVVEEPAPEHPSQEHAVPARTSLEVPSPLKRAGSPLTAIVLGALMLATAGVWYATRGGEAEPDAAPAVPGRRVAAAQPAGAHVQRPSPAAARQEQPRREAQRGQPAGAGAAAPESTRPAAESTAATAPVAKGTLRVRTEPPYAEIFVDGDSVGVGSAFDIAIAAGVRHLKVTAPSYATFDTTFTVTPGRLSNLGTIKLQVGP
jgi:serine/threonine protein kinase